MEGSEATASESSGGVTRQEPAAQPRCGEISERGIKTGRDFAAFMSALMSDVIARRIDPLTAAAACNAGGKLLKAVEMEHKYGNKPRGPECDLKLAP